MALSKEQEQVLLKYAFVFHKLLEENKKHKGNKSISQLGQLSIDAELRPATLSNIFNGRSNVKATTIAVILKSMKRTHQEFGECYDSVSERELIEFKTKLVGPHKGKGRPKLIAGKIR